MILYIPWLRETTYSPRISDQQQGYLNPVIQSMCDNQWPDPAVLVEEYAGNYAFYGYSYDAIASLTPMGKTNDQ